MVLTGCRSRAYEVGKRVVDVRARRMARREVDGMAGAASASQGGCVSVVGARVRAAPTSRHSSTVAPLTAIQQWL